MMIKIVPLTRAFPDSWYDEPHARGAMLYSIGMDYYRACCILQRSAAAGDSWPLPNVMLPAMHQTLELLIKAVAMRIDDTFDPRKQGHKTIGILETYADQSPVFASIVADPPNKVLLEELYKSYLLLRYGEAALTYDAEDWHKYVQIAQTLADDLYVRFGFHA